MFRLGVAATIAAMPAWGPFARAAGKPAQEPAPVVRGRLSCSLKRTVAFPFHGIIKEMKVQNGQEVHGGDVLLRYTLTVEEVIRLKRRVSPDAIDDLQVWLLDLTKNRNLLEDQKEETTRLREQNLASPRKLQQIEEELGLVKTRLEVVTKRLARENKLLEDDLRLLKDLTGETINADNVPQEVSLVAPIDGYVLNVNPDIRINAETVHNGSAFVIGLMDPMILQCQVHEQDAVHIALGDPALFTLESVRGTKFRAKVSLISWQPTRDSLEEPSYYDIELTVPNPDVVLKEGFQGDVTFKKLGTKSAE